MSRRPRQAGRDFLALRDRLYAAFMANLSTPGIPPDFAGLERDQLAFIADRSRRYRQVSRAWTRRAPPQDPLRRDLLLAQLLFNHGLYFDTHEFLEGAWRRASGPEKTCLQGLIQIAAGFHKLELSPGSKAGAFELLGKGLGKLEAAPRLLGPDAVAEIARRLKPALSALAKGRFSWRKVPLLRWARFEA